MYDPSRIQGSTSPQLPTLTAPASGGGCGIGQIIVAPMRTADQQAELTALQGIVNTRVDAFAHPERYNPDLQQLAVIDDGGLPASVGYLAATWLGGDVRDKLAASTIGQAVGGLAFSVGSAYAAQGDLAALRYQGVQGTGSVVTQEAYKAPENPTKVFVSTTDDGTTGLVATALEHEIPGSVAGIDIPISNGIKNSDADIKLTNGYIVEIKSGRAESEEQAARQAEIVGSPEQVIIYGPSLGGSLQKGLISKGFTVLNNMNDLIDHVKSLGK